MNSDYIQLIIWVVVIGVVFGFLWHKGYLMRLSNYWFETVEELKKCTWPSVEELKGSTIVIMITLALLGVFTMVLDYAISSVLDLFV